VLKITLAVSIDYSVTDIATKLCLLNPRMYVQTINTTI